MNYEPWVNDIQWTKSYNDDGTPMTKGQQIRFNASRKRAIFRAYKELNQSRGGNGQGGTNMFQFKNRGITPEEQQEFDEEVSATLARSLHWGNIGLQPCKTVEEFVLRTDDYFRGTLENNEYPLFEKYCLALGYGSTLVNQWLDGRVRQDERILSVINWGREIIKSFSGEMVEKGKIPPVPYIYRSKNYYDMVDTKTIVQRNEPTLIEAASPEELESKYMDSIDGI